MPDWRRFVFDTSTAISAALNPQGKPRAALVAAGRRGDLLASEPTFAELESRLHRKKFDRYLDAGERAEFLDWMAEVLSFVEVTAMIRACRDPNDDKFLELAVSGAAHVIISSDKDLLDLHPFRGIPVLLPADLLAALSEQPRA